MIRKLSSFAVLVAASLTLAGCFALPGASTAGSGGDAPAPDTAPATGVTISGTGYSYQVPDGWDVPPQDVPGFTGDTLAVDLTDADGFSDNVNVLLSPAGEITPDQVESLGVSELESSGGSEVEVGPRLTIAGAESAHLRALFGGATPYRIEQYYPTNAGQTYVVTFSFSEDVADADRVAVAESILASWAWS